MARPRSSSFTFTALLVVGMIPLASCGRSPEQELLGKYFQASRLRDNGTLSNIATVSFSPTQEGTIQKFSVTRTSDEKRAPLNVRALAKSDADLRKAEEEFNKTKKAYQDANREAIDRVLRAEATKQTLKGKDAEVQAAWRKWRDDASAFAGKLTDSRKALSAERGVAELSTYDSRNPLDVSQFDGDLVTREVFFDADVKSPEGPVTPKKMHAVLARAELKNGPDGKVVNGRWVITHVSEEGAPPPAR